MPLMIHNTFLALSPFFCMHALHSSTAFRKIVSCSCCSFATFFSVSWIVLAQTLLLLPGVYLRLLSEISGARGSYWTDGSCSLLNSLESIQCKSFNAFHVETELWFTISMLHPCKQPLTDRRSIVGVYRHSKPQILWN